MLDEHLSIHSILQLAEQSGHLSDVHLGAKKVPAFRINGDIVQQSDLGVLTPQHMVDLCSEILHFNKQRYERFLAERELDCSFVSKTGIPYRVNAYFAMHQIHVVLRKINNTAHKLEDLIFADTAQAIKDNVLHRNKGLYIVTGPTGSGKSTSLVAMIDYINHHRTENIITVEDPVEFIFAPDKCLISQREVGQDTLSFANALKFAMREDPDIILVGEIRDRETAEAVLKITESGHVVFSTMHTPSAALTINRFVSFFPPDTQGHIGDRLSEVLLGVQAQTLVKTADQSQRVGVFEIMFNTTAVRNNIRKRDIPQLNSIIATTSGAGMVSMAKYAERLYQQNIIDQETYTRLSDKSLGAL